MRKYWIYFFFLSLISTDIKAAEVTRDTQIVSVDSMDRLYQKLQKQSDSLKSRIDSAAQKIEAAKAAKNKKVNYWLPILGGAVLGIVLALWLRSRKSKK